MKKNFRRYSQSLELMEKKNNNMNSISHNQHAAFLSEIIGPRLAGTKQEAKAADYIADQFKQIGLDTSIEEFKFLNWMPVSNPVLQILTPKQMELELAPMGYTLPSPPEGVEGILKKTGCMVLIPKIKEWIRYGITDEAGNDLAFLVKNPADGDPSPFPSGRPLLPQIGAIIGKNQAEMIDRWIDEGAEVRVRLINQCCQEVDTSGNVLAKYGDGDPDIVVCAHYDSQYLAPGAVDNGSGIQALLEIAGEIVSERCDYNILFAAFGAEEPGLLGSKAFVFRQQEMGKIGSIRACVNFDMMGCGNEIAIRTGCGMDALVDEMIRTFEGKTGYPVKKVAVTSTSDNWNFHEAGISNLQFVGQPFPVYHLPADTMEFYDEKMVTDCIKMGIWVINKLIKSSK